MSPWAGILFLLLLYLSSSKSCIHFQFAFSFPTFSCLWIPNCYLPSQIASFFQFSFPLFSFFFLLVISPLFCIYLILLLFILPISFHSFFVSLFLHDLDAFLSSINQRMKIRGRRLLEFYSRLISYFYFILCLIFL